VARIALIIACAAGTASAAPLSVSLDGDDGIGWAERAGTYRDDAMLTLRVGLGLGDFATFDTAVTYDLEHLEAALRFGSRVRLYRSPCWEDRGSLYLHGEFGLVNADHLVSSYDVRAGLGHWGHLTRWVAWFAEVDGVLRVGDYTAVSARVDIGIAFETPSFWR
jgi:hypothetical protein